MAGIGMLGPVLANAAKQVTAKKMTQNKNNPSPFKKKKVSTKARKAKKTKVKKKKSPPFNATTGTGMSGY